MEQVYFIGFQPELHSSFCGIYHIFRINDRPDRCILTLFMGAYNTDIPSHHFHGVQLADGGYLLDAPQCSACR